MSSKAQANTIPETFTSYVLRNTGGSVHAGFETRSLSDIDDGEVVIRQEYAGINFKDALGLRLESDVIKRYPIAGGIECNGSVLSSSVAEFQPGDRVAVGDRRFGIEHDGGFSEIVRVPAGWLRRIPDGLDFLESAAIGAAGYTAALAIHLLEEQGGSPADGDILVNGATGGVASMAIDMLATRGYRVVAMSSKPDAAPYLHAMGAAEVIAPLDAADPARRLLSGRWAGAFDSVGGPALDMLLRCMQPRGVVLAFGNAGGNLFSTNVMPFILRGVRLVGVNVATYAHLRDIVWQRIDAELRPRHLEQGTHVLPFSSLPAALDDLLCRRAIGRTVISYRQ